MSLIQLLAFAKKADERGTLVALEAMKNIPFEIKRVYYLTDLDSQHSRGFHAHRQLKQVAICLKGHCRFILDNGYQRQEIGLDNSAQGIFIEEMVWREMHEFSKDCVLMVLASEYYSEDDYIRSYDEFIKAIKDV